MLTEGFSVMERGRNGFLGGEDGVPAETVEEEAITLDRFGFE